MRRFFAFLFGLSVISFFALILFFQENYLYSASLHLGMFSLAMFFLWKKDWKTTLEGIGIPGNLKANIIFTVGGFVGLVCMLIGLFVLAPIIGLENDSAEVGKIIRGLPFYVPLLAIIIAPISEELLFRAFLVPRIGIAPAAIAFAVSHLSYGSAMEIAGALVVGILFGLLYRASKSVIPCMAVHFAYNLLSILAIMVMAA
ncbi:MAG: type II CAAX endopeptidase family protein [Candidatus Micrarchaeota archaeon]